MTASKNIYTIWKKQACGTTPSWSSSSATTAIACLRPKVKLTILPYPWSDRWCYWYHFQPGKDHFPDRRDAHLAGPAGLDARAFTFGKNALSAQGPEWAFLLLTMALVMWMQPMPWCLTMREEGDWAEGENPGPTVEVARRIQQAVVGDYLGGRGCGNSPTFSHLYPPCCRKAINVIIWESKYYFVIRRRKWGVAKHYIVKMPR